MKIILSLIASFVMASSLFFFQNKPLADSIADGKEIYLDFCVQCHLPNGMGVEGAFPPLAKSDYLANRQNTIRALKYGLSGSIKVNGKIYNGQMATQGLDEEEIADVLNYIYREWGNTSEHVFTADEIQNTQP